MIPRWFTSALAAAALSAAFAACSKEAASAPTGAAPADAPPASTQPVDIEAEAQKAAAGINESNADAELEKLKAEIESE